MASDAVTPPVRGRRITLTRLTPGTSTQSWVGVATAPATRPRTAPAPAPTAAQRGREPQSGSFSFGSLAAEPKTNPKAPRTTAPTTARLSTGLWSPRLHWSLSTALRGITMGPAPVARRRWLSLAPSRIPTIGWGWTDGAVTRTVEPTRATTGSWAHSAGALRSAKAATAIRRQRMPHCHAQRGCWERRLNSSRARASWLIAASRSPAVFQPVCAPAAAITRSTHRANQAASAGERNGWLPTRTYTGLVLANG